MPTETGLNPLISPDDKPRRAQEAALKASDKLRKDRDVKLAQINTARAAAKALTDQIRTTERAEFARVMES